MLRRHVTAAFRRCRRSRRVYVATNTALKRAARRLDVIEDEKATIERILDPLSIRSFLNVYEMVAKEVAALVEKRAALQQAIDN